VTFDARAPATYHLALNSPRSTGGIMKTALRTLTFATILLAPSAAVFAAAPKTYQVTGPIVEVTPDTITVMKGKEKWEIAREKDTKVTGDLKAGAKVTIMYRMTATTIEAKGDAKAEGKAEGKADAKAEAKPDAKAEKKK
jgi:hypothetical protein